MADPVVHGDADGNTAIFRNQIRDLDLKREKTALMCHGQFPVEIYFGGMGHRIEAQYLTLTVVPAQKCRKLHGSLVISPAIMIPVSRVILLIIIRGRNTDHLHLLRCRPGISRFRLISQFELPYPSQIDQTAGAVHDRI